MNNKIWTASEIKAKLQSGDKEFLTRGLMAIYERQTATEKLTMETVEDNGVGFTGWDARILTSFAEQWRRSQFLSHKQFIELMKRMPKYAGQLAKIAEEKRLAKTLSNPAGVVVTEDRVTADASEAPVANGWVTFPNGILVHCQDLVAQYDSENEVAQWEAVVDGTTYVLFND